MTSASLTASFAPGAYVFPGGGIDPLDAASSTLATRRPARAICT
jgi:recombination protein RecT